jgi:hypothetical protein
MISGAASVKSEHIKMNRSVSSARKTMRIFSPGGFLIRSGHERKMVLQHPSNPTAVYSNAVALVLNSIT